MKITGIIAEYNPFHQGHIYHIRKTREITRCDCLVVIVTGCFSQRGLPSLLPKKEKTRLALEFGANLVLECPVCFGSQSADYFARYNIQSLSCIPIDTLCFGSETNNISTLEENLKEMESTPVDPRLSFNQNLERKTGPNDLLAMYYIKYCRQFGIQPVSIQRNPIYQSATQTRTDFFNGKDVPYKSLFFIEQNFNSYYPYLSLTLQLSSPAELAQYHLVNEGIEYRLQAASQKAKNWDEFLSLTITKNYSRSRIQRTCLMILLKIKKSEMIDRDFFQLKVLGLDSIGKECLKHIHKDRLIMRFNQMDPFLQNIELKTNILYNSVLKSPIQEGPVILYDR